MSETPQQLALWIVRTNGFVVGGYNVVGGSRRLVSASTIRALVRRGALRQSERMLPDTGGAFFVLPGVGAEQPRGR